MNHNKKMRYTLVFFLSYMFGVGLFWYKYYLLGGIGIVFWIGWQLYILKLNGEETERRIKYLVEHHSY